MIEDNNREHNDCLRALIEFVIEGVGSTQSQA